MLTKDDLRPILERLNDEALCAYADGASAERFIVRVTSGTTGAGPLLKVGSFPRNARRFGESKRLLVLAGSNSVRLANVLFALGNEGDRGETVLALDGVDLTPALQELLSAFLPDAIVGLSSFIRAALEKASAEPFRNVAKIALIGELCPDATRQVFARAFPDATITMEYINSEIGKMGDYCPQLAPNQYHPWRGVRIEIDEPAEEVGEILASRVLSPDAVVERYRTGDAGRLMFTPCPCGREETFEVFGRIGYDYIKAGGAQLIAEEFERVLAEMELYATDFRATVSLVPDGRWQIRLSVVPRGALLADPEIRELFRQEFEKRLYVTPVRTLAKLVDEGIFAPLFVELAGKAFPLENKVSKLRLCPYTNL